MGIAKAGRTFLEERHKLAQRELDPTFIAIEREEMMFWKGVNAALDLTKILDGKEAA